MQLLFTGGFSNAVSQAVCWTLIHSLWHGLIAAVVAALIVTFTKRSAAYVRYNLLIAVLSLFVLSIGITAAREIQGLHGENKEVIATPTATNSSPANIENGGGTVNGGALSQNLAEPFSNYCNQHASLIVFIWFLLFLVKFSQLLVSLRYIHRIRHYNNCDAGFYWKHRLSELAQKTGIRNAILFLESELVKVPAVIGFLKPVLLVPAGLLANLPPEQVEAILLHELAHIRRRDFLVNLLQSIVEVFFFFNPAIVWISSLLREEREACCDDMVVANIPHKTNYLQALVSFQELQFHTQANAIALTGHKHYLLNRVKRMLTLENKKLNLMEKTVLLLGIIGITAFSFMPKETGENPVPAKTIKNETAKPLVKEPQALAPTNLRKKPVVKQKKAEVIAVRKHEIDTLPKTSASQKTERSFPSISSNTKNDGKSTESQIEATDNEGKRYSIKRVDGQITELKVNGAAVPQNQFDDYSEVIRQIDEVQRQRILKRKEVAEVRKAEFIARQKEKEERRKELSVANQQERIQKTEWRKQLALQHTQQREQTRQLLEQKNELRKTEYHEQKIALEQNKNLLRQQKAELVQKQKLLKQGSMNNDDINRIISDLSNQKLITDTDNLSFSLNNNELVVNGKKQTAEIHQQFKEKYIQNSKDLFNYSKKGNSTSITINKQ